VVWAVAGWGFGPAQATRLIGLAPEVAPVTMSLHASAVYLGIAAGSALGALTIEYAGLSALGLVAALCKVVGLAILVAVTRARRPAGCVAVA
jgi:predicted MFS family arabinose efflux permease